MPQLNISGWPEYLQPIEDLIAAKYHYDSYLGEGKTATAYKIVDQVSGRAFCLKTIAEKVEKEKRDEIRDTLRKEVEILDPLSHQMIPQIYERDFESTLPFYICTYHPGKTFLGFKQGGQRLS